MSDTQFTVGDLVRQLRGMSPDTKLSFGGGLTFYRVKHRADDHVFVEFNEIEANLDEAFKRQHPNVLVAFIQTDSLQRGVSN